MAAKVTVVRAQLYRTRDGWRWRTLGGNGEPLAYGESYKRRADARAALKAHLPAETPIDELGEKEAAW